MRGERFAFPGLPLKPSLWQVQVQSQEKLSVLQPGETPRAPGCRQSGPGAAHPRGITPLQTKAVVQTPSAKRPVVLKASSGTGRPGCLRCPFFSLLWYLLLPFLFRNVNFIEIQTFRSRNSGLVGLRNMASSAITGWFIISMKST